MSNDYYTASAAPATGSAASSAVMRAEFLLIEAGLDKLPDLTTVANRVVHVNAGSTALVTTSGFTFDGTTLTAPTIVAATAVNPDANDGAALGTSSLGWSDLFLASGAVIDFANTNVVLTHSTGVLTVSTGDLRVTTAGTNAASAVTVGGTQTLTAKTLTSPTITTSPTAAGATWTDLGTVTTVDINGGTIDGATIGGASAGAGTFTTGSFSSTVSLTGTGANLGIGSNYISNDGTDAGLSLDASNNAGFSAKVFGERVRVGSDAVTNDATGMAAALQFGNAGGAFATSIIDAYIYKLSANLGSLTAHTLVIQTRDNDSFGGFAFVNGTTPTPRLIVSAAGDTTLSGTLTVSGVGQIFTASTASAADKYCHIENTNGALEFGVTAAGVSFFNSSSSDGIILSYGGATKLTVATAAVTITDNLTVSGATITTGSTTALSLATSGGTQFKIDQTASAVNNFRVSGAIAGGTPFMASEGSDTDIGMIFSSKGTDPISFYTNTAAQEQVRITHTASATNYLTLTGSNGGDPNANASGGNLSLGAPTAVATTATAGLIRIPTCAGTPTGAVADGNMVIDTTNHKLYFRSGATWRDAGP